MKEIDKLNKSVLNYLFDVILLSDFENWIGDIDDRNYYLIDIKKHVTILYYRYRDDMYLELYLHENEEETNKTTRRGVYGEHVYKLKKNIILLHKFYFFNKIRKIKLKLDNVEKYFKDKKEYDYIKTAFDSLPLQYKRKEKLEQLDK